MFHVKQDGSAGFDVSRETAERLTAYAALVRKWNPAINLFSRNDLTQLETRHIADALQLAAWLPADLTEAIDLGSGGGIPGVVLAVVTRAHWHLVESDKRKAAFLAEAARVTGANITVHACRIEQLELPAVIVVTARALAPLPLLLQLAHRFIRPDGFLLAPKGRTADAELTEASRQWHMNVERSASKTDLAAYILKISEVRHVRI